jgi:hypothetical protein
MSAIDTLKDAVAGIVADWPVIRKFTQGAATDTIETDAGTLPVIAKVVADAGTLFEQAKTDLIAQKGGEIDAAGTGLLAQTKAAADSAAANADTTVAKAASAAASATSAAASASAAVSAQAAGLVGFASAAEMNGNLGFPARTVAVLASDGSYWIKQGASGAGSWSAISATTAQSVLLALNARVQQASYRGWKIPFVDAQGKLAGGINRYGRLVLTFGGDIAARLDAHAASFSTLFATVQPGIRGSRMFAVTDRLMTKIAMEVRQNGHLVSMGRDLTDQYDRTQPVLDTIKPSAPEYRSSRILRLVDRLKTKVVLEVLSNGHLVSVGRDLTDGYDQLGVLSRTFFTDASRVRSGYQIALVDAAGRVPFGVTRAGRPKLLGRDVVSEIDALKSGAVSNQYISPSINIITPGDSLTNGAYSQVTWREALPNLLTTKGRTVTNAAVGGMTSTQIAARIGAYKALLTAANNTLLASGATTITSTLSFSADSGKLETVYPMSSQSSSTIRGYLNNVLGTLQRGATDDALTFLPDKGQLTADISVPTNMPFEPILFAGHDFDLVVVGLGRNNMSKTESVKRDLLAVRDWQKTIERRVIVITPPNGTGEGVGTAVYNYCVAIEQWAQQTFGECAVLSRQILMAHPDPANAQDATDVAAGIVPSSLRMDTVHWTTAGHALIAQAVAAIINRKGW